MMIKLPKIKQEIIDIFYLNQINSYKQLLQDNETKVQYERIINFFKTNSVLDENKIKNVLIGEIGFLLDAIDGIGEIAKPGGTLVKGDPVYDFCHLYDNFKNRDLGKTLADDIGVNVCPYCNRTYIYTLRSGGVRPQYDHFFSKAKYPYLAVSIYNLIPSCNVCNLAKSDFNTFDPTIRDRNFIYPYEDEYGYEIKFKTEYNGDYSYMLGGSTNFKLEIDGTNAAADLQRKVKITKNQLKLEDLYEKHKPYVLDIIKQAYIYDENYVRDLFAEYPNLFRSIDEVKDLIYMNYLSKEKWGDRVLAKLTYDIQKESKR